MTSTARTILTALAIVAVTAAFAGTAAAQRRGHGPGHGHGGDHGPPEGVNTSAVMLENGAIIEVTADDPELVEGIIEHSNRMGQRGERGPFADLTETTVEVLENGVQVTLTSDDADAVEHIQRFAERRAAGPEGREQMREERRGERCERRAEIAAASVTEVTNLENGVQVTTTSQDPEVAAQLIAHAQRRHEGLSEGGERGDNGARGRGNGRRGEGRRGHGGHGARGDADADNASPRRGGGDCPGGERGERGAWRENVDVDLTTLDDGFVLTMTTDDTELVERIQQHAARRAEHGPRDCR